MGNVWWKTLIQQTTSSLRTLLLYSDRSSLVTVKCCLQLQCILTDVNSSLLKVCFDCDWMLENCTTNEIISLMDDIAAVMYFLFTQTKQQYIFWAAFINGLFVVL